jgi:hypothetical protein
MRRRSHPVITNRFFHFFRRFGGVHENAQDEIFLPPEVEPLVIAVGFGCVSARSASLFFARLGNRKMGRYSRPHVLA